MITTDILIIGAGPSGLFAVFEAGLLKMRCHVIDALPQVGGQLYATYPHKPIYDIPGFPKILAKDLVANLMAQIAPFKPSLTLGERTEKLEKLLDGRFQVTTNKGTIHIASVVVIAGGLGAFEPRKPNIENVTNFEEKGVDYIIPNLEKYQAKKVVISGGGILALNAAIELVDIAQSITLVHRRKNFRGMEEAVKKVEALAEAGKIDLIKEAQVIGVQGNQQLENVTIKHKRQEKSSLNTDYFLSLLGLVPKLGSIAEWGLNFNRSSIEVNSSTFETNTKGIFVIGDMSHYQGKMRLILCGFHEATLMVQAAFKIVHPDKKLIFRYTTGTGIRGF